MRLFNYVVEADLGSLQPITHFKIHRYAYTPTRHLVWWKLSMRFGAALTCDRCDCDTGLETICEDCHAHYYCECGSELTDMYGSPGDGLCRACD